MSRRSVYRSRLDEELDGYDININKVLKRSSKDLKKLKEAKRMRNRNYVGRKRGKFIYRRG